MYRKRSQEISRVTLSDGSTYELNWVLPRKSLQTEVDPTVHNIWNSYKDTTTLEHKGRVSAFTKRFGSSFSLDDKN